MIDYEPGRYGVVYALSMKGSVFPRASIPGIIAGCAAAILHFVMRRNPEVVQDTAAGEDATQVLGAYSFILGFLIVFRSQQAYARWWEGGTLLQQLRGEWFNCFSCLIAFCNSAPEKKADVHQFQHQLVRLFSLLYGCALQQVTDMEVKDFELISLEGFEEDSLRYLQQSHDRCEITLQWIQKRIVQTEQQGLIKIAPPILSRVFNELGNGIVNLNNARKIRDFPIPFHLAQMITIMLIGHSTLTVFSCATSVDNIGWSSVIACLVVFSYWSVYYISLEMEMPFGDDLNDLPLHAMQQDMNKSLSALLDKEAQHPPEFTYVPGRDDALKKHVVDFNNTLVPSKLRVSLNLGEQSYEEVPAKCSPSAAPAPAAAAPEDAAKYALVDVVVNEEQNGSKVGSECPPALGQGGDPELPALTIFKEEPLDLDLFGIDLGEEEGQPDFPKEGSGGRHRASLGGATATKADLASGVPPGRALASRAPRPVRGEALTELAETQSKAPVTDFGQASKLDLRESTEDCQVATATHERRGI